MGRQAERRESLLGEAVEDVGAVDVLLHVRSHLASAFSVRLRKFSNRVSSTPLRSSATAATSAPIAASSRRFSFSQIVPPGPAPRSSPGRGPSSTRGPSPATTTDAPSTNPPSSSASGETPHSRPVPPRKHDPRLGYVALHPFTHRGERIHRGQILPAGHAAVRAHPASFAGVDVGHDHRW
jgi:hypothetical protein